MITKRISGQQKQPGSFILQAEPLSRSYHVAESICRIYNNSMMVCHAHHLATSSQGQGHKFCENCTFSECGHVAYQIKGYETYDNIQANILHSIGLAFVFFFSREHCLIPLVIC